MADWDDSQAWVDSEAWGEHGPTAIRFVVVLVNGSPRTIPIRVGP